MKRTEVACALMARDGKGIGNLVPTNAVMEVYPPPETQADGILLGKSKEFTKPPLKDLSRTILTDGQNGVVEWKKVR